MVSSKIDPLMKAHSSIEKNIDLGIVHSDTSKKRGQSAFHAVSGSNERNDECSPTEVLANASKRPKP